MTEWDDIDEFSVSYVEGLQKFAEWIVSLDDDDPNSPGRRDRQVVTLTKIINRAREALGD